MKKAIDKVLVINSGSSSLKYQLFSMKKGERLAKGLVERIGCGGPKDHTEALKQVVEELGTPKDIDAIGHRVLHGAETFKDSVKVTGKVGEQITIRLKWPAYDPDAVSEEYKAWASFSTDWPSFFEALWECMYRSSDEINWERIENAKKEGDSILFSLTLSSEITYLSAILRYTETEYEDLTRKLSVSPYAEIIPLGRGYDGVECLTFAVTDPTVPSEEKKTVYLQGLQHCHESPGGHVCDSLLRFLISDEESAARIRKGYIFRVTPVTDAAGWRTGNQLHPARQGSMDFNFNRDWGFFSIPEVKAIADYLDGLKEKGERLCFLADLHGGTGDEDDFSSGASISYDSRSDAADLKKQDRFCELVKKSCDYLGPAARDHWANEKTEGTFTYYAAKRWGPAYTFEVSMSKIWDRSAGRRFPNSQAAYRRFGRQLAETIAAFLDEA